MASLSRTASLESAASSQTSQADNGENLKQKPHTLASATSLDYPKQARPLGINLRTPSHSLLSSSPSSSSLNRKGRFADTGTTGIDIGRASISMPPPTNKSSAVYRPSINRRPSATVLNNENRMNRASMDSALSSKSGNESTVLDDVEGTPNQGGSQGALTEPTATLTVPEASLRPPSDTDGSSNRLSLSSLYSLGSAIYSGANGPASAPQSTASSNAGSVKSTPMEQPNTHSASLSPIRSSLRGEVPSSATTATDIVTVVANTQLQHTGCDAKLSCSLPYIPC